ncbi:ribosome recycling factor [Dehalobacterium formicoaceticum]|uniref:Ribosome-recycling factor n=1 Tax=Dehalobacterium formicoaceticum TaxID=51515 RepID=A0ABT1Y1G0_9FIRM|nr:ribosome recycling factor [Dehalobacterium formicoaceticum]MCR6544699.1 ribosome recycling factor [Dehalobacterium formicoaceticum]
MIRETIQEAEERMSKTVEVLKKDFASLRAGRATPALLDKVQVDYYGTMTPVNQMANVSVPEARLLLIQPWDKSTIPAIEKAILKSDLGLTPSSDGNVIRIGIPQLTEERRKDLVKSVKKKAEEARVAVRNVRRDTNDMIKDLEKEHEISEDESKRGLEEIQKTTDKFIKKVDEVMNTKEQEIMEV